PTAPVSSASSPEGLDHGEGDATAIAEDKRRRNTLASARFRVKKKLWTLNLERSISDLSGRVEELEREAAELRRENGWLKEIVMLKSKRFGGPMPTLDPPASQTGTPSEGSSGEGERGQGSDGNSEDSPDSNDVARDKGKGKERERS
ncbi:hypothetical protein K474DRAFT_1561252, partial [Panus rudis PR-1116 ss-1]